jgi:choice-of-anchor B domain-containing protein
MIRDPSNARPANPTVLRALLLLASLCFASRSEAVTLRNMEFKAQRNDYPPSVPGPGHWNYSNCWSYVHSDGREYAVIGVGPGTAIYNVTNPAAPYQVGFIAGPPSLWREMKQYRNWIYIVTEGPGVGEGLQVVRMTNPESPVLVTTYTGNFHRSHTVSVDTSRAILVCNGTRAFAGGSAYYASGMRILSLANPEAPVEIGAWPAGPNFSDSTYVHDCVPIGNRLYASSIYYGIQRVFDIANPAAPVQIAAWTYSGGFTHNCWPDKTGNWLYVTDEKNGEPLKVFNISNLSSPVLFNTYTPNPGAIVHNVHVRGDEIFLSNYTEGIRILDATDPAHPAEFAYADSYDGPSGNYDGVWGVCPYFPSGTVIASDMNTGLYIYRPRHHYGLVRVKVLDAVSGLPLPEVKVFRDAATESLATTADGVGVFAMDPGSHSVTAKLFGYNSATATRGVGVGNRDTVTFQLQPQPRTSFSGTVRRVTTEAPLEEAEVKLAYTPLHQHTEADGSFEMADVPVGVYRVEVRCPGYIPVTFDQPIGPSPASMTFHLAPVAVWNPVEVSTGWTVGAATDNATSNDLGQWILVDPVGTVVGGLGPASTPAPVDAVAALAGSLEPASFVRPGAPIAHEGHREAEGLHNGPVQPEDDRTPSGTRCYVTGQGTNSADYEGFDLDGVTTLTSPTLDAAAMAVPTIGFWRWFYTSTGDAQDYLDVLLSNNNGGTWTLARRIAGMHDHWEEEAIRIADYLSPTTQMKVRFVASEQGSWSVAEAAVDDLTLYDSAAQPVGSFPYPGQIPPRLEWRTPWPNPARSSVKAVLGLPARGRVEAEVLDLQGRRVAKVFDGEADAGTLVLSWDGRGHDGRAAVPGVYFLRALSGDGIATVRFVKLQ